MHLVEVKKIDINIGDYDGRTALHLASEEGHLEVVKYPHFYSFSFFRSPFLYCCAQHMNMCIIINK